MECSYDGEINQGSMQKFLDEFVEKSGSLPTKIFMTRKKRREYVARLIRPSSRKEGLNLDQPILLNVVFNGIPIAVTKKPRRR